MNGVARGTPRARVRRQSCKSSARFLERIAAPPEQHRFEALLAQVVELVEVKLERTLVPAKLAPKRAEMVEAARHQSRKPQAHFLLRLVELHHQIDITDLERAARVGTEDPDLAHPRHVATLSVHHATQESLDPPARLRALHGARVMRQRNAARA
jgi:hypothetical protein